MPDCLIIGGGVMGLSVAYELATRGLSVQLFERGKLGREASWAGAGILPPPATREDAPAWKRLQALSYGLHENWSARLREETGIDNGYHCCGAIHLAHRPGEAAALRAEMSELAADGVRVENLNADEVTALEPSLARIGKSQRCAAAYHLPDEAQIRNPDHLRALAAACRQQGVVFHENTSADSFRTQGEHVSAVATDAGEHRADAFVLAAGAWSEPMLHKLGLSLSIYPVRGQMILYQCQSPPIARIINEGPRYIVPRSDGRVLVGSTEEDVGFDKRTTDEGIADLRNFAEQLLPCLRNAAIEKTWAGLRPHAVDGFPYIGRAPQWANCYVAAGHFRAGLATSTGTAVLLRQLITGDTPELDISEFRPDR